ncbi:SH3 domain-containing protein [Manganibacter manganicus]|uniref:SH3 domain-containing protein n=1 Tax=Manganibacter manganicus TaxID=1873176 RepID=UPI0009BB6D90|nr:SH3 domain-containing protein [Pseudaminobacter manganicus]
MSAYLEVAGVKGSFRFGMPRHRRYSMQYGYDARPSLWQRIRANAHFVIAGVGTVSLLGIAGIGLWLAMPGGDRQAFAEATKANDHAEPVIVAGSGPVAANTTQSILEQATGMASATSSNAAAEHFSGAGRSSGDAIESPIPNQTAPQELKQAFASTKIDPIAAAAVAVNKEATGSNGSAHDNSKTAAIPTPRPTANDAKAENDGEAGHILRGVNMRARPKKGATVLTTIPAKTQVKIISCKNWCEVVYQGKHGWVYKSFVTSDG